MRSLRLTRVERAAILALLLCVACKVRVRIGEVRGSIAGDVRAGE
jgi:hypothetical protein